MNLYEYLEEYKTLTLEMMDKIREDGNLDVLVNKREEILKAINELDFDKEDIKRIGNSLNLLELEEELELLIKKEKVEVKKKIESLKKTRQANANYNKIEYRARVFNKTI